MEKNGYPASGLDSSVRVYGFQDSGLCYCSWTRILQKQMYSQWKGIYGNWSLVGEDKVPLSLECNRRRNDNNNKKVLVRERIGQDLGRHLYIGGHNIGVLYCPARPAWLGPVVSYPTV